MNCLARENVNAQPSIIEVLDVYGATGKCSDEFDLATVKEIVLFPDEARVGLLLDLEHDVAGLDSRGLVALALEFDAGSALNSPVNMDVQNLAVDYRLLAVALLASVLLVDDLALAVAVGAGRLEALDHGAHLAHHVLHTMAVTAVATTDGALLATAAFALSADDGALQSQLRDLAPIDVLQ